MVTGWPLMALMSNLELKNDSESAVHVWKLTEGNAQHRGYWGVCLQDSGPKLQRKKRDKHDETTRMGESRVRLTYWKVSPLSDSYPAS